LKQLLPALCAQPLRTPPRAVVLKSHIAPEVAEESVDHLRATIHAQKRRLRRCRSGGTVDEDELVKETLRDHPPEARGTRAEWARRTGWHRREDTRRRAH